MNPTEHGFAIKRGAFLVPLSLVIIGLYVLPFLGIVGWSFTLPEAGLGNYVQVVTDPGVGRILWRTARICLLVTFFTLIIAYVISYLWVFSSSRWQRIIELCVLIPFWISVLVRAFGWIIVLRGNGVLNNFLMDLSVIERPLRMTHNEPGVIVAMTHFMVPFAVFPLVAVMRQVDVRMLMASRGLGAGRFRTFWSIFVPQTMPGIVGAFIIVFVFSVGFYITPAIVGGGRVVMIAEYIYMQMFQTTNWGLGAALSVILLLLVSVLAWAVFRVTRVNRLVG